MVKYIKGDKVFYFDSLANQIVYTKVEAVKKDTCEVRTPSGCVIDTLHIVDRYILETGVELPEYLLFRDPFDLIDRYLVFFGELRNKPFVFD